MLTYSIVIATRNRQPALRLSIPRMLSQSRPPDQLIVIDSSDDHGETVVAVNDAIGTRAVDLTVKQSARGSALQRNLGLDLIEHPIVICPDDDSIFFPGAAAQILTVYELDDDQQIAAVCTAESSSPPVDWEVTNNRSYQMRRSHVMKQKIATRRAKIENLFFPDPARVLGRSFYPEVSELPSWFAEYDIVPVEWMTGFRMSYRTDVIRKVRFDERLTKYSLFEDIDASYGAWAHGLVVGARKAKIYHYRSPENRASGRRLGICQLLNKAYVIAKHSRVDSEARSKAVSFFRYKLFQYRLSTRGKFRRSRYEGAVEALPLAIKILSAEPSEVFTAYQSAVRKLASHQDQ